MTESRFKSLIKAKNVVYITVKNKDYIRTRQIERILAENAASFRIYSSEKKTPLKRALDIRRRLGKISFEGVDVIVVGFLPQLILDKVMDIAFGDRAVDIAVGKRDSFKLQVVADMFLSLYDTVVWDRKLVRPGGLFARFCKKLDRRTVEEADLVLTDTRADADYFAKEFEGEREKFEVLYLDAGICCSNKSGAESIDIDGKHKECEPENIGSDRKINKKINSELDRAVASSGVFGESSTYNEVRRVLYFGTGLPLQGTDIVADAFRILVSENNSGNVVHISDYISENKKDSRCEIKCIYIGSTKYMSKEQQSFITSGQVEYHEWLSEPELIEQIEKADICLAGHFKAEIDKADRTIPGKAFIYEALGKKMILADTSANREIFKPDDRHIFVRRGSGEALSECIRKSLV